ncbi:hypothetical protein Pelsub_P1906 [Pelolinea submarina]|uniref:RNHCP domain-containing protein n=1 Tax=Pelolinea submarina TaxID=913107 RepID=A0A347ZTP6_9CHLR|nr:hypothetical protein DFR64_0603 [Pelolinea submarina]BBB48677.1 hypothetical protein Pelsub_P1906 [Pelolinea submarina]
MQPIGLTLKPGKVNRYARENSGEIMLVHYCLSCGRISCNRIAGDDNAYSIIDLLNESLALDSSWMREMSANQISLLTSADKQMVLRALFGNAYLDFDK